MYDSSVILRGYTNVDLKETDKCLLGRRFERLSLAWHDAASHTRLDRFL